VADWQPGFHSASGATAEAVVVAYAEGRLLVDGAAGTELPTLGAVPDGLVDAERLYGIGELDGIPVFAAALARAPKADEAETTDLRSLMSTADGGIAAAAVRAAMVVEWELGHAFCGRCGTPTTASTTEFARICASCGAHFYPRITPAAIMLVEREGTVLLAKRAGLQRPFRSVLAGFVEPGETLEETVRREVLEEVAVEVQDVRYFGSQSWPFPSQLMIGFTARYAGGEIRVDDVEIADAAWYPPDALPQVPPPYSIAGQLIADFVARNG
jgi:NAD+ diphosphatase